MGGLSSDRFSNLTAAHIFPVSQLASWSSQGYSQDITGTMAPSMTHRSGIFFFQTGLLLRSLIHSMFDYFMLSINPDVSKHTDANGAKIRIRLKYKKAKSINYTARISGGLLRGGPGTM